MNQSVQIAYPLVMYGPGNQQWQAPVTGNLVAPEHIFALEVVLPMQYLRAIVGFIAGSCRNRVQNPSQNPLNNLDGGSGGCTNGRVQDNPKMVP